MTTKVDLLTVSVTIVAPVGVVIVPDEDFFVDEVDSVQPLMVPRSIFDAGWVE